MVLYPRTFQNAILKEKSIMLKDSGKFDQILAFIGSPYI
jgi:hypothetical protein